MKKFFIFSFIVLGISSIISQVIIIRELIISFYGNEFFIGWILFGWLLWVGLGSLVLPGLLVKIQNISKIFISCHILVAVFLPLEIYLARLGQSFISGAPGEIPNLIPALFYTLLIIAPLCLILGLQFAIATRFWSSLAPKIDINHLVGKSYFYETIGFIIGGLIFSYFLIFINEFRVSSILALFNLIAAGGILILTRNRSLALKLIFLILIVCFSGIFVFSENINVQTNQLRFPNQKLVESRNSPYGNIAVTKTKEQYNFYESGLLLGTDKEEIFNEYLVHFPFLYHSNPKNILLIGTGFNGALGEILKYQPNKIYHLEIDPQLLATVKKYISSEARQSLEDKKVQTINIDARFFLKNTTEKFDVVLINLPDPSTALINRFYSREFLKEIRVHLNPQGVLALHLSSSPNYLNPELENLQASLYKTIKEIFTYLVILPEDTNFFIASSQNILDYNPQPLIQRLKERNIKTNFVTEPYIKYRLTNDRVQAVLNSLRINKGTKINQDQRPISYYYNLIYWLGYFRSGLAKLLTIISKIQLGWIIGLSFLFAILMTFWRKRFFQKKNLLPVVMAAGGLSLMAAEIIIIFAFQIFYGYLYYKIALIITALFSGMAVGNWIAVRKIAKQQIKIRSLILIHGLIIVYFLLFILITCLFLKLQLKPSPSIEFLFLALMALIGGLVGFEFPYVNQLYLAEKKDAHQKTGIIYGADLFGSCLGALLISVFAIPIFGIFQTLILLAILNALILIPLSWLKLTN